jgi:uncharacterized integral membrane protein
MKRINWKRILPVLMLLCITAVTNAQNTGKQTTDLMRSNGRIYVVIAVMLTILTGLILYLVRLEKKISRLEKDK